MFWTTPGSAWILFLALTSGITTGGLRASGVLSIEPRLTTYKAGILLPAYPSTPVLFNFNLITICPDTSRSSDKGSSPYFVSAILPSTCRQGKYPDGNIWKTLLLQFIHFTRTFLQYFMHMQMFNFYIKVKAWYLRVLIILLYCSWDPFGVREGTGE